MSYSTKYSPSETDINVTFNVTIPREQTQPEDDNPALNSWQRAQRPLHSTMSIDPQYSQIRTPREASSAPPQPELVLSEEQNYILDLVKQGKNIFFTGAAGMTLPTLAEVNQLHYTMLQVLGSLFYFERS